MFVVYIIVSIIMVVGIIACILGVYYTKKKNNLIILTVTNIPNDQRLALLKQTILNSGFQDSDIKVLTTPANSKWTWNELDLSDSKSTKDEDAAGEAHD